jgi:prepilin-type processing-associated H-X9-DG protein
MSYATPVATNQAAVWSAVFGMLFFIPLAAPGLLAIVFGRRGIKAAKEQGTGRAGLARLGIVLGIINLVLTFACLVQLPFALARARRAAMTVACASNLRQIGLATMIYANGSRGFLPSTVDQIAATMPGGAGKPIFICPACGTNPAKPPVLIGTTVRSHYHYIPPAARISQIKQASRTVLAYEPPTNHDNITMNVLFADGHVESIRGPLMTKIAAELAAGQNPPPSQR